MATIISDGMEDARMFGIECQIVRKDMSFHAFVQEYGQPYGVTVDSLLMQASANAHVSPLQRQHSTPEPQPEPEPEPEPAFRMHGGNIARTAHDFLVGANLGQYLEVLVAQGGLALADVQAVTDDDLLHFGITKEFHRKRFLREARQLVLVGDPQQPILEEDAAGGRTRAGAEA